MKPPCDTFGLGFLESTAYFICVAAMLESGKLLGLLVALSSLAWAQQYVISTIAGAAAPASQPVPALSLTFGTMWGIGGDSLGNTYLASSDLCRSNRHDIR